MPIDVIQTTSYKRQRAWGIFSESLRNHNIFVDGLPARKQQVFDMLYIEGDHNIQLWLVQDRLTDFFTIETHVSGNSYVVKQYGITYKERDCKGYNPRLVEENNVKTIIGNYVKKQVKSIRGTIDMNRLSEILNTFAFTIYQGHDKIEKEADKLYKPI